MFSFTVLDYKSLILLFDLYASFYLKALRLRLLKVFDVIFVWTF